ncbi:MAG: alkaline phosphatase family protein, partial [Bacteroidota bacterium]
GANTNSTSKTINNLTASTAYQYEVRTNCSGSSSGFSAIASFTTLTAGSGVPPFDHVVVCIMENHGYTQIIGSTAAPHINALSNDTNAALFTQSYALTHPSQPNYLQFYSGSAQGVTNDNVPANNPFTTANLGAELIAAGKSFTTYSEDLPSVGYNGASSGNYARKHNPAANWMGTGTNQIPTTNNQPFTAFPSSANYASLPSVSYVVPNQNNDMHNGSNPGTITTGDNWMFNNLNNYIQWAKTHNSLFILTFDEDDGSQGNRIATIFCGPKVLAGSYSTHVDHYNVLRTVEEMFSLTTHAGSAATAAPMNFCWKPFRLAAPSDELGNNVDLDIYPNPASTLLNVIVNEDALSNSIITITDFTGRQVYSKQNPETETAIDITFLPKGVYILKWTMENKVSVRKFVKD